MRALTFFMLIGLFGCAPHAGGDASDLHVDVGDADGLDLFQSQQSPPFEMSSNLVCLQPVTWTDRIQALSYACRNCHTPFAATPLPLNGDNMHDYTALRDVESASAYRHMIKVVDVLDVLVWHDWWTTGALY